MTTLKNIPSLLGGAVLTEVTIGLTAGLAPASAAPAQTPGVNLYVFPDPANSASFRVTIKGLFPMDAYDANGYINNINGGNTSLSGAASSMHRTGFLAVQRQASAMPAQARTR